MPTGQRSISRSAASAIISTYWAIASPWNGGSSSLRWRMWRGPTAVSTELGPRIGRSGDSPVSDGACSGFAVKSDLTWSGWLVMTGPPGIDPAHAEDFAELAARPEDELDLAHGEAQGLGQLRQRDVRRRGERPASSAGSIGPAGEGGAAPTSPFASGSAALASAAVGVTVRKLHRSMS